MELHPVLSEANTMKHARHVVEAYPARLAPTGVTPYLIPRNL
jgi:hypothetical protein